MTKAPEHGLATVFYPRNRQDPRYVALKAKLGGDVVFECVGFSSDPSDVPRGKGYWWCTGEPAGHCRPTPDFMSQPSAGLVTGGGSVVPNPDGLLDARCLFAPRLLHLDRDGRTYAASERDGRAHVEQVRLVE